MGLGNQQLSKRRLQATLIDFSIQREMRIRCKRGAFLQTRQTRALQLLNMRKNHYGIMQSMQNVYTQQCNRTNVCGTSCWLANRVEVFCRFTLSFRVVSRHSHFAKLIAGKSEKWKWKISSFFSNTRFTVHTDPLKFIFHLLQQDWFFDFDTLENQ